jgi:hypothetical protein
MAEESGSGFARTELRRAPIDALQRLARYLKLQTKNMKAKQIADLIFWRLHKNRQWGK